VNWYPTGFMAWEKTWLYRVRDCYLAPWKLNEESISVEDLPARAFDTPEEKERVAMILERYNKRSDADGRKKTPPLLNWHANAPPVIPLRTYVWLSAARAVTIWFTAAHRAIAGFWARFFPLAQMREDDPVDQEVTSLFFFCAEFVLLPRWACGARPCFGDRTGQLGPQSCSWCSSSCSARPS